ncbi:GNAT family N-acetyltransferase [soil metagenome]
MDIDVVRPQDLSAQEIAAWTALQRVRPEFDTPFLSPHWARHVERAQAWGDAASKSAVHVAILREEGRAKGFFAAKVSGATAMPAGAPMCDYQGIVAEPGVTVESRALLDALGVARLDFSHMLEGQDCFSSHIRGFAPSYLIEMPEGYETYAEAKKASGSGIIKDLDKRRRKVEREIGPCVFTPFSRSKADFDQLIEWKREQYRETGQTDVFATGWTARLLRDLFQSRDPEFGGVLYTLHIGDTLAAAHFHLRGRDTIHAWIIAHDCAFEKASPGLLLFQDIMRWMDETPYCLLDLGAGDYRFKQQLASSTRQIGYGFAGKPSAASLVRHAAYGIRDVAERLPLGKVSALPGKAMRRFDVIRALR